MAFGTPTRLSISPGIRHEYVINELLRLNHPGANISLIGQTATNSDDDVFKITSVSGFEDADVRDSREALSGTDGETSLSSLAGGRTIVLEGYMESGSMLRIEDMRQALRESLLPREEWPLRVHDRMNDWRDNFGNEDAMPLDTDYTFDAGNISQLGMVDGKLIATNNSNKRIIAPQDIHAHSISTMVWKTPTSVTNFELGHIARRVNANTQIIGYFSPTVMRIYKRIGGTNTSLVNTAISLSPSTEYYSRMWVRGNEIVLKLYSTYSALIRDQVPIASLTHLLAGGDITTLGQSISGTSGVWWTPATTTNANIDSLDIEVLDRDVEVMCLKSTMLQGVDQQTDMRVRRPFMVTIRASSPDMLAVSTVRALKVTSVSPPLLAFEEFSNQGDHPAEIGLGSDNHFTDDSSFWGLYVGMSDSEVNNGKLVADLSTGVALLQSDKFNYNGALVGNPGTSVGWTGAGDTEDFVGILGGLPPDGLAKRSAVSDAAWPAGRWEIAGSTDYGDIAVSISGSGDPQTGADPSALEWGVFARYNDTNNNLRCYITDPSANLVHLIVKKRVAGTDTLLSDTIFSFEAFQLIKLKLVVDGTGNWAVYIATGANQFNTVYAAGYDSQLKVGGALDEGKVGFFEWYPSAAVGSRYYSAFRVETIDDEYLSGWLRYFDALNGVYPTIGNGTHTATLDWDKNTSGTLEADSGTRPAFYMILKSIRGSTRYLALKCWIDFVPSTSTLRMGAAIVKFEGGVETSLATAASTLLTDWGEPIPTIILDATVTGNLISCGATPEGYPRATVSHTLTSTNATNYGTSVEGETGFMVQQGIIGATRPKLAAVDRWTAEETIVTPTTLTVTPKGNVRSLPKITITGPLLAGSYLICRDSLDIVTGKLTLAKDLGSGVVLIIDSATNKITDVNGDNAAGYVSLVSDDIELMPGEPNEFEFVGSWIPSTTSFAVSYKDTYR